MIKDQSTRKIYLFCCSTSYDPNEILKGIDRQGLEVKVINMPCSGKLDILYLTKAFETGADGAAVMICKAGECRYLEGNLRARKRADAVEQILGETGLSKGRVAVIQLQEGGVPQAIKEFTDFCTKIREMKG